MAYNTKSFFDLYVEFTLNGKLPDNGLCACIGKLEDTKAWALLIPSDDERLELRRQDKPSVYWGREEFKYENDTALNGEFD